MSRSTQSRKSLQLNFLLTHFWPLRSKQLWLLLHSCSLLGWSDCTDNEMSRCTRTIHQWPRMQPNSTGTCNLALRTQRLPMRDHKINRQDIQVVPLSANNLDTSPYKWNGSSTSHISPFRTPNALDEVRIGEDWTCLGSLSQRSMACYHRYTFAKLCNYLRSDNHVFKFHPRHEILSITDRCMPQIKIGLSAKCTLDERYMILAFQIHNGWLGLDRESGCHT